MNFSYSNNEILSHPGKLLNEHLKNTGEIAKLLADAVPFSIKDETFFTEVAQLVGLYHDIGKATYFFQQYIKENAPDKKAYLRNQPETKHSLISAIATYFAVEEYLRDKNLNTVFTSFLPIASFISVRRHHTDLQSVTEDLRLEDEEVLKKQVENLYHQHLSFLPYWDIVHKKLKEIHKTWKLRKIFIHQLLKKENNVLPYLIQHLLYSLLLDADKHEVTVGQLKRNSFLPDMIEIYRKKMGFSNPKQQIDIFRNEIYQKVINQAKSIPLDQDRIFSLSSPTGSGKTLAGLGFAIKLRSRIIEEKKYCPRIIYCLPFLTIIDQNAKIIREIFKSSLNQEPTSELFLVHHHLSDYYYTKEDTEYGIDESEILIEGWNSEIIVTTFVQLFHTLFSNRNRAVRKFHKILSGIIILDEVQSFPHKYWTLFRETAEAMTKYFGTYFILSTATQPAIFENSKELLEKKYFEFFNRTQLTVKTNPPKSISEFVNEFMTNLTKNPKNTMVVFNTIRSAEEFFTATKEPLKNAGYDTYFLSSHVVPYERLKRIENIKNSTNKKVLVSTQLVEAGVDIDLEKVIRDFGPFDTINQVAGRANRNSKMQLGEVEVIVLKDDVGKREFHSYIYDPVLIDNTKRILQRYTIISEKEFLNLINQYYQELLKTMADNISQEYLEAIKMLNYEKIAEFELIEEKVDKIDVFIELNDEATEIWEQYQKITNIQDLKERKNHFLSIRGRFYQYVISIPSNCENIPPQISGFRCVTKNCLNDYYDTETGYITKGKSVIW